MIKALRKKFILINMLLVSVVLVIVFSAQCYTKYRQIQNENIRTLQMALDRREDQKPRHFEPGQRQSQHFSRSPMFVVRVDSDGAVQMMLEEQLSQIVVGARENGEMGAFCPVGRSAT